MKDIKFRAWNGKEWDYDIAVINGCAYKEENPTDDDAIDKDGRHYYTDWAKYNKKDWPLSQFTGLKAPCGREIWFGDFYYNAGYGNLHINTMADIVTLMEGLAENDIGDYLGNQYENNELLESE
jgi:hypothetical protein